MDDIDFNAPVIDRKLGNICSSSFRGSEFSKQPATFFVKNLTNFGLECSYSILVRHRPDRLGLKVGGHFAVRTRLHGMTK